MELTSKQRAQLRGMAASLDTILHVGKDGIGDNLVKQADNALEARELIKGKVLDNNLEYDARLAAEELAKATRSGAGVVFDVVVQHPALDELPGLQGVVRLLHQVLADAVLADMDDGVDAVGKTPQLGPLFACQFHLILLII